MGDTYYFPEPDFEAAERQREQADESLGDPRFTDDEERWGDYSDEEREDD